MDPCTAPLISPLENHRPLIGNEETQLTKLLKSILDSQPRSEPALKLHSRAASSVGITSPFQQSQHKRKLLQKINQKRQNWGTPQGVHQCFGLASFKSKRKTLFIKIFLFSDEKSLKTSKINKNDPKKYLDQFLGSRSN